MEYQLFRLFHNESKTQSLNDEVANKKKKVEEIEGTKRKIEESLCDLWKKQAEGRRDLIEIEQEIQVLVNLYENKFVQFLDLIYSRSVIAWSYKIY